jgi:hypothetical protein
LGKRWAIIRGPPTPNPKKALYVPVDISGIPGPFDNSFGELVIIWAVWIQRTPQIMLQIT